MNEIFLATASCSPTGRPHCTRSRDHSLAIFNASFPVAAQLAGSDSRPVFSVVSAIFRPWPSAPMRAGGRNPDLVESGHPVFQAAQAHERIAPLDGDPVRGALDHERA